MPNSGGSSVNISQYMGYRVFIYRLNLPGKIDVGLGSPVDLNAVIQMDSADPEYAVISDFLNSTANFQGFLTKVGDAIKDGMRYTSKLKDGTGIFQTIDITPLVESVGVTMNIESENTCSLVLMDPSFQDFGDKNLETWSKLVPQYKTGDSSSVSNSKKNILDGLKGLVVREFDLIRVMAYSKISMDKQGKPNDPPSDLASRVEWFSAKKIDTTYAMTPQFTGLVTSITRTAGAGGVPATNVSCLGMARVFTQSVVVASEAIANAFALDAGDPNLSVLLKDMNTLGQVFHGKTSEEAFCSLMSDYLHPIWVSSVRAKSSGKCLGIPTTDFTHWSKVMDNNKAPGKKSVVPFMPLAALYHIMKQLRAEPVVVFDDKLDGLRNFVTRIPGASANAVEGRDADGYTSYLTPYLSMTRDTYDIFDASYMSASDVFGEIRRNTFYEIFEDRAGAMHMRFPRYNSCLIRHRAIPETTLSTSWVKDDSAVFNTTLSQNMMAYYGKMDGIAGSPYMDRLSILKFGMRAPQITENPNAVDPVFSRALSKFMRDYHAGRESRKAQVRQLLDTSVMVGDQVMFEVGPTNKIAGPDIKWVSGEESLFVGYVTEISETMTVSGQAEQTLSLSFVRPIDGVVEKSLAGVRSTASGERVPDVVDYMAFGVYDLAGNVFPASSSSRASASAAAESAKGEIDFIAGKYAAGTGMSPPSDYVRLTPISLSNSNNAFVTFKPLSDPIELAKLAAVRYSPTANKAKAAFKPGKGKPLGLLARLEESEASVSRQIDDAAMSLGANIVIGRILQRILSKFSEGATPTDRGEVHQPWDIHDVYLAFKSHIARSIGEEGIALSTAPFTFTFLGDPNPSRTIPVRLNRQTLVTDMTIVRYAPKLTYDARDMHFSIVSEYTRLFPSSERLSPFTSDDVKSADKVMRMVKDVVLPAMIVSMQPLKVAANTGMQELFARLKEIDRQKKEIGAPQLPAGTQISLSTSGAGLGEQAMAKATNVTPKDPASTEAIIYSTNPFDNAP